MYPSASDLRARAREALRGHWTVAVFICLVAGVLNASLTLNLSENQLTILYNLGLGALADLYLQLAYSSVLAGLATVYSLVCFVIGGAITLGQNFSFANLHRGREFEFSQLFSRMNHVLRALGLTLFTGLFIFLWTLLLVVPGILAFLRYAMAPWLMAENPELTVTQAVNMSKYMMQGNKGRLFCLGLSFIGWVLLIAVTCGLAGLWVVPYMKSALAAFYLDLLSRKSPYNDAALPYTR